MIRIGKALRRAGRGALVLGLLAGVTACITLPKPLYFTLDMSTPPGEGAAAILDDNRNVVIDEVRVNDKLVRRDVLIRIDAVEYEYYHDAKWIAQVSDLVEEKLAAEFAAAPEHDPTATYLVYATLLAFEQVDGEDGTIYASIKLNAEYRHVGASRYDAIAERTYTFYEPVDAPEPLPKQVVDKLSEGLEVIAREMAEDINSLPLEPTDE